MKILEISDTHINITTPGQIRAMLREAAREEFDVIVHAGDYCGGSLGWKSVKATVDLIRKQFPDKPFLSTIGNHDYWCRPTKKVREVNAWGIPGYRFASPSARDFDTNLAKIKDIFKAGRVHFLDKDGVYIHPDYPHVVFIGASGWYNNANPPTNDKNFLPIGYDGDTNRAILKQTEKDLFDNADTLKHCFDKSWQTLVFVSHFPVIPAGRDYKGAFEDFSWAAHIGTHFIETYDCKYFLNGHAHQLHKGPLRYECGPDYHKPTFLIVEVV